MSTGPYPLVDDFFRRESASVIAVLTRAFGLETIDLAEDAVQAAMLQALQSWRQGNVPDQPAAWLHRVAKNRMISALRRDGRKLELSGEEEIAASEEHGFEPDEIEDSLLGMIFACCHPSLERRSQLALTLKILCGLGDEEVGRALFASPGSVKRRVSRAKRLLVDEGVALHVPEANELEARVDVVHEVLYLLFNEGYSASRGNLPVRIDLCEEAARLAHVLCESGRGQHATSALLALMLFHAARLESRTGDDGAIILLGDQDRRDWDWKMIAAAESWFERSAGGDQVSRFHLEAGIARQHCIAPSVSDTDWAVIVRHYDVLLKLYPSPLYRLNRAVALGQLGELEEPLRELRAMEQQTILAEYPLLHCALADLLIKSGQRAEARHHLHRALVHVCIPKERELIEKRLRKIATPNDSSAG
jgi:RNA polymerase sigma-70 factor (ECF subfamily)